MKKRLLLGAFLICSVSAASMDDPDFFEVTREDIVVKRLEESVITTENFETSVRDTPRNITIITSEEIERKGATDISDVVKNVPGLTARKYADGEVRFDIRGQNTMYANRNVVVTVDGVPINKINGGYDTSQIPVGSIERVEVVPGGGGVLYGNGTLGGVVNIVTKSPQNKENYGSVSTRIGSDTLLENSVDYGTKITDNLLAKVGFTDLNSDGWREDERDDKQNIRLRTMYLLDKGDLEFKYNHSEKDYKYGTTIPYYMTGDRTQVNSWSQGKNKEDDFYLKYRQELTDNLELLVYGNYYEKDYDSYNKTSGNYFRKSEEERYYTKSQLKYSYAKKSYLIVGGDFSDSKYLDIESDKQSQREAYGGFVLNKFQWGDLQFTQGYRRDFSDYDYWYSASDMIPEENRGQHSTKSFTNDAWELSLSYSYSETGSVYTTYSRSFRTPTTTEIGFWLGPVDPQVDDTIEVGIKDYIGDTYISASAYYKKSKDQINMAIPDEPDYWQYSANFGIGDVDRYGLELFAEHYIGRLTLRSSFTYIEHEIVSGRYEGNKVPSVPNVQGGAGASYLLAEGLTVNLDAIYHGKMYDLDDLENKRGETVDDYIVVDFTTVYILKNGLTITGGINNIFDEGYDRYVGAWEDFSQPGSPIVRQHLPAPGRTYTLGVKYNF